MNKFIRREYKGLSPYRATEQILRDYKYIKRNKDLTHISERIESALDTIRDDYYYQVITRYYFDGETREEIAFDYNTSVSTISRNKTRLVNCVRLCLFR